MLFFVIAPFYFKIGVASFKAIDWTFSLCYHFFGFHSGAFFSWLLNLLMPLQKFLVAHLAFAVSWFFFGHGQLTNPICSDTSRRQESIFCWFQVLLPKERVDPVENVKENPLKKNWPLFWKKNKKASNYLRNLAFSGFATHIVFKRKRASFTNTKVDNMFWLFHTQ